MSLFQNSVVNKYLKGLETAKVDEAWKKFTAHFHNPTIQENIRNSKEEQYQGEFLIDLFVKVFGFIKNPTPEFNLTTELKNARGAKKTDGAILKDENALAVIELKGTNTTDLSKIETQAFGYKNNQPGCVHRHQQGSIFIAAMKRTPKYAPKKRNSGRTENGTTRTTAN